MKVSCLIVRSSVSALGPRSIMEGGLSHSCVPVANQHVFLTMNDNTVPSPLTRHPPYLSQGNTNTPTQESAGGFQQCYIVTTYDFIILWRAAINKIRV
jgi:hypothetical protein